MFQKLCKLQTSQTVSAKEASRSLGGTEKHKASLCELQLIKAQSESEKNV